MELAEGPLGLRGELPEGGEALASTEGMAATRGFSLEGEAEIGAI